jgi:hypothetical protein
MWQQPLRPDRLSMGPRENAVGKATRGIEMDLFDFFFPEQAEAAHLRRISSNLSRSQHSTRAAANTAQRAADDVAELRSDVAFLTLVLAAILKRLAENETMSLADVSDLLKEMDGLDGVPDGGLNPGVLRGMLGVLRETTVQEPDADSDGFNIDTRPTRYRRR